MKNHVTSLELSLRLKELGVKQESLFWWYQSNYQLDGTAGSGFTPEYKITQMQYPSKSNEDKTYSETIPTISAFTVAELGEMLPTNEWTSTVNAPVGKGWSVEYHDFKSSWFGKVVDADTEANARAKMLIYLIENGLLDVKNIT